ncbi:PepSY domain-containing protein [Pontibacter sp. 172403-2]|uniref:PepSY-associated TM helix domain-containing protein n=1 Tax=Pontibacter rufus TaxID=2791028 RepID=UPI0018AF824C|nr:PepSY-associated TM helix domain-containing protein [Pontibacter sp. 172403-2]MBF9254346.1 PepSY domain-containing protein [Pontibacter sp. 172403-2]
MKVFFRSIHLYLSLASGLVIGLVCLTGAALVFEKEFQAALYPERYKVEAGATRVPLEQLVAEVQQQVPGAQVTSVKVYDDPTRTVELSYAKKEAKQKTGGNAGAPGKEKGKGGHGKKGRGSQAFLNPYTGQITGMSEGRMPFFDTMFSLHRWLLLDDLGKLIVGCSTFLFLFIILTGLILWWPKQMKMLKQRLTLKWNTGWKRINHDLHLVIGFYTALFLFIFAFTGLAWSFAWFNDGIYTLTGTENIRPEPPKSSVQEAGKTISFDEAFAVAKAQLPGGEYYTLNKPAEVEDAFTVTTISKNAVHERASDQLFLDQYTGHKIGQQLYADRNLGQRVRATFYPVHVGSIAGMPGRIIAFLSCIAGFTFPITGLILWINRLKKNRKKARKKVYAREAV